MFGFASLPLLTSDSARFKKLLSTYSFGSFVGFVPDELETIEAKLFRPASVRIEKMIAGQSIGLAGFIRRHF